MPHLDTFFANLAALQHRSRWLVLGVGLALAVVSTWSVSQLSLNSSLSALLPEDKPSVRDLRAVSQRIGGLSTLSIAIQSEARDVEGMQRFARDLVARLESLQREEVRAIEWNVQAYEDFVRVHKALYVDTEDLEAIIADLQARLEYERAKDSPFHFSLEDQEPPDASQILERFDVPDNLDGKSASRSPGGFFLHADRDLLAIFVRTDVSPGDVPGAQALISAVDEQVLALDPKRYGSDLHVEYAGDLLHQREEHEAIARELVLATTLTVGLVLLTIFAFFRSARAIPLLGLALAVPTLITFGIAKPLVDYLNTSTAFLGSIVIGNGINPNVMWLSRYFEERQRGAGVEQAIRTTHRRTWRATLTASAAAAVAYGSLTLTDFRGFRDFGVIGGLGMLLCWLSAYLLLPAATSLYERYRPLRAAAAAPHGGSWASKFAALITRTPKLFVWGSLVLGLFGVGVTVRAVLDDPIEYDFRNLRSIREGTSRASLLNGRIKTIVGGSSAGQAIAVVLDSSEAADSLEQILEQQRLEQHGAARQVPYGSVRSARDLLPREQTVKIPLLQQARELMREARPFANQEQKALIDRHLPQASLRPLTPSDLPRSVTRHFTERDGTLGRILFVEQNKDFSLWDGRYLVDWAAALRRAQPADGSRVQLAGQAPVFADMTEVVWEDGPKAVLFSFLATLLLVSFAFRRWLDRMLATGALLLGIVWMAGTMALFDMKLNFLNFVAFPVTFGNGVDYGVNVLRRYRSERDEGLDFRSAIVRSVESSGGAVVLCSLTTVIGYSSLYVSSNRALNSFGAAMAISELTCLLAAIVTIPAALAWTGGASRSAGSSHFRRRARQSG